MTGSPSNPERFKFPEIGPTTRNEASLWQVNVFGVVAGASE